MRELILASILESNDDVVVLGDGLDFAPELNFIEIMVGFHEFEMSQFKLHP